MRAALDESGLPAPPLELEITESTVARDLQQVTWPTGYSSLAYLRLLPIQKLKVDRTFVKGIPDDKDATALVGESSALPAGLPRGAAHAGATGRLDHPQAVARAPRLAPKPAGLALGV